MIEGDRISAREPANGTDRGRGRRKGLTGLLLAWIVLPLFFFITGGSLF